MEEVTFCSRWSEAKNNLFPASRLDPVVRLNP